MKLPERVIQGRLTSRKKRDGKRERGAPQYLKNNTQEVETSPWEKAHGRKVGWVRRGKSEGAVESQPC